MKFNLALFFTKKTTKKAAKIATQKATKKAAKSAVHSAANSAVKSAIVAVSLATLFIAAQATAQSTNDNTEHASTLSKYVIEQFGEPPSIPAGELSEELQNAVDIVFDHSIADGTWGPDQTLAVTVISESSDPRLAWLIADLMRFITQQDLTITLAVAAEKLLNIEIEAGRYWGTITDHLIAWNIPAPPNYLKYKSNVFTGLVPGWDNIFTEGTIDWRHVSWGGVLIDDRAYDTTDETCNCIPAADNPEVVEAKDATWPADDQIVFGVEINGETRAYPRQIMEVREMVNDTLGGRDIGMPYCTLCGAAQVYFTDELAEGIERPVLRTSGLLIRSNKVMYDITTNSVLDTFTGEAVTGELLAKNVKLEQAPVVTTTWGQWKEAHPETTVLAEELALGRNFDFKNNRDANGPIFPVGNVDPRLSVHDDIVGVLTPEGEPLAFDRRKALLTLTQGDTVELEGIMLVLDGGGIKAVDKAGNGLGSHEAFWFAWSQFHPETQLWPAE